MVKSVRKRCCGGVESAINSVNIAPSSHPVTPRPATVDWNTHSSFLPRDAILAQAAFHDTDILARIVARMSAWRATSCSAWHRNNFKNRACRTCRRGSSRGCRYRCRCRHLENADIPFYLLSASWNASLYVRTTKRPWKGRGYVTCPILNFWCPNNISGMAEVTCSAVICLYTGLPVAYIKCHQTDNIIPKNGRGYGHVPF